MILKAHSPLTSHDFDWGLVENYGEVGVLLVAPYLRLKVIRAFGSTESQGVARVRLGMFNSLLGPTNHNNFEDWLGTAPDFVPHMCALLRIPSKIAISRRNTKGTSWAVINKIAAYARSLNPQEYISIHGFPARGGITL